MTAFAEARSPLRVDSRNPAHRFTHPEAVSDVRCGEAARDPRMLLVQFVDMHVQLDDRATLGVPPLRGVGLLHCASGHRPASCCAPTSAECDGEPA